MATKKESAKEIHNRRMDEFIRLSRGLIDAKRPHKTLVMKRQAERRFLSRAAKPGSKFTIGDRMKFLDDVLSIDRANPKAAHKSE